MSWLTTFIGFSRVHGAKKWQVSRKGFSLWPHCNISKIVEGYRPSDRCCLCCFTAALRDDPHVSLIPVLLVCPECNLMVSFCPSFRPSCNAHLTIPSALNLDPWLDDAVVRRQRRRVHGWPEDDQRRGRILGFWMWRMKRKTRKWDICNHTYQSSKASVVNSVNLRWILANGYRITWWRPQLIYWMSNWNSLLLFITFLVLLYFSFMLHALSFLLSFFVQLNCFDINGK